MKAVLVIAVFAHSASECVAQSSGGPRWTLEFAGGAATFRESYRTNCCGPTRSAGGSAYTLRAGRRAGRFIELGAEFGATAAGMWRTKWLMPVVAVSRRGHMTPWLQFGAGVVSQIGDCPADGPRPAPACDTDLVPGGQVASGLRLRLTPTWSLGGEIGFVRGAADRERYVKAQRAAIAVRWH